MNELPGSYFATITKIRKPLHQIQLLYNKINKWLRRNRATVFYERMCRKQAAATTDLILSTDRECVSYVSSIIEPKWYHPVQRNLSEDIFIYFILCFIFVCFSFSLLFSFSLFANSRQVLQHLSSPRWDKISMFSNSIEGTYIQ